MPPYRLYRGKPVSQEMYDYLVAQEGGDVTASEEPSQEVQQGELTPAQKAAATRAANKAAKAAKEVAPLATTDLAAEAAKDLAEETAAATATVVEPDLAALGEALAASSEPEPEA